MSTEVAEEPSLVEGMSDLTALGKRVEILRIQRGLSKQQLAQLTRASRQQLWRVMTGKSELTSALRTRLSAALSVDPAFFVSSAPLEAPGMFSYAAAHGATRPAGRVATTMTDYLTDPEHLAATLRTLPSGDGGRRLKRAILNALEDLAVDSAQALPVEFSDIRRRVLAGEL